MLCKICQDDSMLSQIVPNQTLYLFPALSNKIQNIMQLLHFCMYILEICRMKYSSCLSLI